MVLNVYFVVLKNLPYRVSNVLVGGYLCSSCFTIIRRKPTIVVCRTKNYLLCLDWSDLSFMLGRDLLVKWLGTIGISSLDIVVLGLLCTSTWPLVEPKNANHHSPFAAMSVFHSLAQRLDCHSVVEVPRRHAYL